MLDKKILISIVIVLVIGVAAASYQATTKTSGVWQSGVAEQQLPTEQSSGSDGSSALTTTGSSGSVQSSSQSSTTPSQSGSSGSGLITAASAKIIAQKNIQKDSQATAGTPVSTKIDGKSVYNVPIMSGTNQVGYFIIDAQTGKIIEGAGGA